MASPESAPDQARDRPEEPSARGADALAAARQRMDDVGKSLAETAAHLREAIVTGTVPPRAAAELAKHLEGLAAQMRQNGLNSPEPDPNGDDLL